MSIRLMSWVWEHSLEKQEGLLVHLALADFSSDTGECFPSLEALASKARITVRSTQRILRRLEQQGKVITERNGGPAGVNLYHMITGDTVSPRQKVTGDTSDTRGVTLETPGGDTGVTLIRHITVIDPSTSLLLAPFQDIRGFSDAAPRQLKILAEKITSKYADVDLEEEALKIAAWLETPKGKKRKCSPGFILKWLSSPYRERQGNGQHPNNPGSQRKPRPGDLAYYTDPSLFS